MKKNNKKHMNFFTELGKRFKTPLSNFWKHIRTFAIVLGTSAVSVLGADKMFDLQTTYNVSPTIFTICGYIIVAAAVLGLTSQITTKHPEDFDND